MDIFHFIFIGTTLLGYYGTYYWFWAWRDERDAMIRRNL